MFDGIKSILQGWRQAGNHPNISPNVIRGYMEAVVECMEHLKFKKKMFLDCIVEFQEENMVPFELSFDAHPFSVAAAYAFYKSNDGEDTEYYAAVLASLSTLAKKLAETRIDCGFYEAFLLQEEQREIASLILRNLEKANKRDMVEKDIDWGVLLISTYLFRARSEYRLLKRMSKDLTIYDTDQAIGNYIDSSTVDLAKRCTIYPTEEKFLIARLYANRCIDNLLRLVP